MSRTFRFLVRARDKLYESGVLPTHQLHHPVISVGNLTVGGTGKTPIVIEIAQWLLQVGKRVAVLSRGYRRTSRESQLLVSDGGRIITTQEEAGDEPYLIAQRCPRAVVAVGADRYRLGRQILETCRMDCIVLNDGFQHLGLHRDVNLLLVDATDAQGLEQVLPAGRLREPIMAAGRATAVIVTRAEKPAQVDDVLKRLRSAVDPMPPTAQVVFRPEEVVSLSTAESHPGGWCQGKRAFLVSGVGHARSFRNTAENLGLTVLDEVTFPDHYRYTVQDVGRLGESAADLQAELVLTTEKDAGKIRPYLARNDGRWWAARLRLEWLTGEAGIRKMIMEARSTAERRGRA